MLTDRTESPAASESPARRARMCSIGVVEAVLHIQLEPTGGGSAESCGNVPAFNTVEILPCAERFVLHMGACSLKIDVLGVIP